MATLPGDNGMTTSVGIDGRLRMNFASFGRASLIIVLFGALGFNAAAYYFGFQGGSRPFWFALYIFSLVSIPQLRLQRQDVLYFVSVAYMAADFLLVGIGDPNEFFFRLLAFMVLPYLCGRAVGKHLRGTDFRLIELLCLLYLVLIAVELLRDPELFTANDRIFLFPVPDLGLTGGDTAFNVGVAFGGACIVACAPLICPGASPFGGVLRTHWNVAVLAVFPVILMALGSRAALAALTVTVLLLFILSGRSLRAAFLALMALTVLLGLAYALLPPERVDLFTQLFDRAQQNFDFMLGDSTACRLGEDSSTARVTLLREAWRLFSDSPLIGIGAGNFGFQYCGPVADLVSPHNILAQILVEVGAVGVLPWMFLVVRLAMAVRRHAASLPQNRLAVEYTLTSLWMFFLLLSLFSGNMYYDYYIFMMTGVLVSRTAGAGTSVSPRLPYDEKAKL